MRSSRKSTGQRRSAHVAAFAALAVASAMLSALPAEADPATHSAAAAKVPTDVGVTKARDKDNRKGRDLPSGRQQAAAAKAGVDRFNAFAEPEAVAPALTPPKKPGELPADPVAAARQYLTDNQDLYALSADSVAAMEPLLV